MNKLISTISPQTLEVQILNRLRDAILEGVFMPGSSLNQVEIAADFGVSRGPIRTALAKLEEEGLIKNIPHRGSFVTPLDRHTVMDLYGVRAVLEGYAVQLAVVRCEQKDLEVLEDIVDKMREAAAHGRVNEVIDYDLQVHDYLMQLSGNKVLFQVWNTIKVQVRRALFFRHHTYPNLQEIADSHLPLIAKLREKDVQGAVEVMVAHTNEACTDLMARWIYDEKDPDVVSDLEE